MMKRESKKQQGVTGKEEGQRHWRKGRDREWGEGKNWREERREEGVSQSCLSRLWSVRTACFLSQTGLPAGSVLTDEMAHAAVTREPGSLAKWGQVAGQLPWSEEFRPSSLKYANEPQQRWLCQPLEQRAFLEECPPPYTWSGQGAPATQWVRATS